MMLIVISGKTLIAKTMKKLKNLICWFFDSEWGFIILILGYIGIMGLIWQLHWNAVYNN